MEAVEARERAEQGKTKEQKEQDQDEVCPTCPRSTLDPLYLVRLHRMPHTLTHRSGTAVVLALQTVT